MTKSFKKIGFIWLVVVALAGATLPVYSQEFVVKKIKLRGVQYHPDQGVSTRELEQKVNAWRWESYPENKLSLEDLEDLAYRVSKFYQDLGFSFVAAFVPRQKIKRGIVIIQVKEDRLAEVTVRNVDESRRQAMLIEFEDMMGKPVFKPDLEEPILLLNDNPNREVFAYFSRGRDRGDTRLNLNVKEISKSNVSVGANNTGSPSTGKNRWWVSGTLNNMWGWDDQLSATITQVIDYQENLFGQIHYQKYLGTRDSLSLSVVNNQYSLGEDLAALGLQGQYQSASISKRTKLRRQFEFSSSTVWNVSYRHSSLTSDVLPSLLNQSSDTGTISYQYASTDYQVLFGDYLTKSADVTGIVTVGGDSGVEDDAFVKFSGYLQSGKNIGAYVPGFITRFTARVAVQYAAQALPSADKSPLGGESGVRAFDSSIFSADESVVIQMKMSFMNRSKWGQFEPYGFYDLGYGIRKALGDDVGAELSGYGLGLGYHYNGWLKVNSSYSQSRTVKVGDSDVGSSSRLSLGVEAVVW